MASALNEEEKYELGAYILIEDEKMQEDAYVKLLLPGRSESGVRYKAMKYIHYVLDPLFKHVYVSFDNTHREETEMKNGLVSFLGYDKNVESALREGLTFLA